MNSLFLASSDWKNKSVANPLIYTTSIIDLSSGTSLLRKCVTHCKGTYHNETLAKELKNDTPLLALHCIIVLKFPKYQRCFYLFILLLNRCKLLVTIKISRGTLYKIFSNYFNNPRSLPNGISFNLLLYIF